MLFSKRPQHPLEEELSAYLDGQLPSARLAEVAEHVKACEACAPLLDRLDAVRTMLSELPQAQPSRAFTLGPQYAAPSRAPAGRSPLVYAPAVAFTLFLALVAVDVGTRDGSTQDSFAGLTASSEAPKAAMDPAAPGADAMAPGPRQPPAASESAPAVGTAPGQPPAATESAGTPSAPGAPQTAGARSFDGANAGVAPAPSPGPGQLQPFSAPSLPPAPQERQSQPAATDDAAETATAPAAAATEEAGIDWLAVFQIVALAAFVLSLAAVLVPRLVSKGDRNR